MEKRLYERISLPIRLKYEVKSRPKLVSEAGTRNISGSGICLSLKEKLVPKTELSMKVEIGDNEEEITLKGRVVWSRRVDILEKDGPVSYFDTGIELIAPNPININRVVTHFYGKSF
ncbi:PilZ domain-containing protein [Candidatus Omnitrophota bacterium]